MAAPGIGIRWGKPTTSSLTAVLVAWTNTPATLTVNGVAYAASWTAIGTDAPATAPQAGYYAVVQITGMSQFTLHSWTLTQGAETRTGTIRTAPGWDDSFTYFVGTCMRSKADGFPTKSAFEYVRYYMANGALPVAGMLFTDDLFYCDSLTLSGSSDPRGMTAVAASAGPASSLLQYDWALSWFAWFGITNEYAATLSYGMEDVLANLPILPTWGDHEFANNFFAASAATPNGYHATPNGFDGAALLVYNALIKPLQGASVATLDTQAQHWAHDMGQIRLVSMDSITRAYNNAAIPASSAWHGQNQIVDCLNALQTQHPFKLITMYTEPRYLTAAFLTKWPMDSLVNASTGALISHPASLVDEYERLFVRSGQTPPSICAGSKTNGVGGTTLLVKGDNHFGGWFHFRKAASGSNVAEDLWMLNAVGMRNTNAVYSGGSYSEVEPIDKEADGALYEWNPQPASPARAVCAVMQLDLHADTRKLRVAMIHDNTLDMTSPAQWGVVATRWFGPKTGTLGMSTEPSDVLSHVSGAPE